MFPKKTRSAFLQHEAEKERLMGMRKTNKHTYTHGGPVNISSSILELRGRPLLQMVRVWAES